MKEQQIKEAKEKYNLSGIVYMFDNGNIFTNESYAKKYTEQTNLKYEVVNLDKKEIDIKKIKK